MPHSDAVEFAKKDVRGLVSTAVDTADPTDTAQVAQLAAAYRSLQPDPADPADEALADRLLSLIRSAANHSGRPAEAVHADAAQLAGAYGAVVGAS